MASDNDLIAGFPAEKWQAFTSPIPPQLVEKTQGNAYVRHQVCTDALNRCFGQDGWTLAVIKTERHEPYKYTTSNGENVGRFFVNAVVRLTIGKAEYASFRDGAGAQVAAGSWDECEKGAVSEALKRAASLFGWASNVYMTDKLGDDWVGDTIMREKQREDAAGFVLPDNHETAILDWLTALKLPVEEQRKIIALVDRRASAYALATALKALAEMPADAKGAPVNATLPV